MLWNAKQNLYKILLYGIKDVLTFAKCGRTSHSGTNTEKIICKLYFFYKKIHYFYSEAWTHSVLRRYCEKFEKRKILFSDLFLRFGSWNLAEFHIWLILKMRAIIFLSLIYISHMSDTYSIPEKKVIWCSWKTSINESNLK